MKDNGVLLTSLELPEVVAEEPRLASLDRTSKEQYIVPIDVLTVDVLKGIHEL